jgi:hypothetical protein
VRRVVRRGETAQEARKRIFGDSQPPRSRKPSVAQSKPIANGTAGRNGGEHPAPQARPAPPEARGQGARDRLRSLPGVNRLRLRLPSGPLEGKSAPPAQQSRPSTPPGQQQPAKPTPLVKLDTDAPAPPVSEQPAPTASAVEEKPVTAAQSVDEQPAASAATVEEPPATSVQSVAENPAASVAPVGQMPAASPTPVEEKSAPAIEQEPAAPIPPPQESAPAAAQEGPATSAGPSTEAAQPSAADAGAGSAGNLAKQLSEQSSKLARQEKRLVELEFKERNRTKGISVGALAAGGVVGFFGAAALVTAAVLALDTGLKAWFSAALVGLILVAVAAAVVVAGKK